MKTTATPVLPLAATLLILGCADLALEADLVPDKLEISAHSLLVREGESAKLDVVVMDQNGDTMDLPSWAPVKWSVTNPAVAEVAQDGSVRTLQGGETLVQARLGKLGKTARLLVNPAQVELSAPVIYVTQGAQNRDGNVPLMAERQALVRVFMVGDQISYYGPSARITMILDGERVFEEVVPQARLRTPDRVDESALDNSVNALIPAAAIQPGVEMIVELDPEGVVPLKQGSQTRYPPSGSTELYVVQPQPLRHILVPSVNVSTGDESIVDWANGLAYDHPYMNLLRSLMPIAGEMELEIHEPFRTNLSGGAAWFQWLGDMLTLFYDEGNRGYYYGASAQSAGGLLGIGYLGLPASVGVNRADVHTHEVGHTMSLPHAPCGVSGDPNFPHAGAKIGVWGYDFFQKRLKSPDDFVDVMSYCDPVWISDYFFSRAAAHRTGSDGGYVYEAGPAAAAAADEMLVVRGFVQEGEVTIERSFVVTASAVLPESDGPYSVEGIGGNGQTEFSLSFSLTPMAYGGGGFVFLVPYDPKWAETLDRMVLTGPEGTDTVTRDGLPMAVVTNPANGNIQAIIRDWDGGALPGEGVSEVQISRGIPTGERR